MAVPNREEIRRRKALMKAKGYQVIEDDSWGPWQEQLYVKATTVKKLPRPVSPWNWLLDRVDELTGNDTYRVEHPEGLIMPPSIKSVRSQSPALNIKDPRMLMATVPLAFGSAILLGNGPEIMRTANNAGDEIRQSVNNGFNWIKGLFSPVSARSYMADAAPTDITVIADPPVAPTARGVSPEPEHNDSNNQNQLKKSSYLKRAWETKKNSPNTSKFGRQARNFGIRVPLYGTAINYGIPTILNGIIGLNTGKTPITFPLTNYIPGVNMFSSDSIPPAYLLTQIATNSVDSIPDMTVTKTAPTDTMFIAD